MQQQDNLQSQSTKEKVPLIAGLCLTTKPPT